MSSRSKLTLASLAAFVLGFAAAHLIPVPGRAPGGELSWEQTGETVQVSAQEGGSYLILEPASDTDASLVAGYALPALSPEVAWSTDLAVRLEAPVAVYRLWLDCPPGAECNDCRSADDCPPPPKPPTLQGLTVKQWRPTAAAR